MLLITPQHALWWDSPWLGPLYLAGQAERVGARAEVLDTQLEVNAAEAILGRLGDHDSVAITSNVATIANALEAAELVRQASPEKALILGGPHATVIYEDLLPGYADIVVLGEGEATFSDILRRQASAGARLPVDVLEEIPGIAYWDGRQVRVTPPRPFIQDLDSLARPAWHLIDLGRYNFGHFRHVTATQITSRGCPFSCTNCAKMLHDGRRMRLRSIASVVDEMDYLYREHRVREIHFWDDNFTISVHRIIELCEAIIALGHDDLRLAILNGTRADIATPELYSTMRRAGFYWITISVESGDQECLNQLGKRLDLSKVPATVELARRHGFQTTLYFMIGLPWDTQETIQKTIDLARRLPADQVFFFMTLPFPGTPMYDYVEQHGRFLRDMKTGYTAYDAGEAVFEMPWLPAHEMERMYRRAYRQFYLRPSQFWRALRKKTNDLSWESIKLLLQGGFRILFRGRRIGRIRARRPSPGRANPAS
jgi:radical SAM superfamily enzyme YgiQ (UPF0313 family)